MMRNRICEILGIEKPVIQGPMVWLTDAKLVAAVSEAGGMGSLGPNAGQTVVTRDPDETAERMRAEIRKVRKLTGKPFSVNVLPSDNPENDIYTPPMMKVIYEEKVPVVTYVGIIRPQLFKEIKAHGIKLIFGSLNPNPEEAKEAEKLGADIIVATGFDEGGTLPEQVLGTFSIVPMIADAVKVPVMAAGGIADHRAFNAALALGAEGVYCGTAFLMSKESRMAANVKETVLKADAQDLLLFRTIPAYYRSLPGKLANELVAMDKAGATNEELGKKMGGFANLRIGMLEGDMENGYVSVGHGITHIHEIKSAKEIVEELTREYAPL